MPQGRQGITDSGFRLPAEWEPQEAIWLSWPCHPESWPDKAAEIERQIAGIAAVISRHEGVRINASADLHSSIERALRQAGALMDRVELYVHPNNDVWCRDHGPLFVLHRETGELAVTDWDFNGWGDEFGPYDLDNEIPRRIAASLGLSRRDAGMVLEGGAIEVNGRGQLLTTEAVLLNPNRNPDLGRADVEARLRDVLGMKDVFWLGRGIEGDDTGGHVDDVVRFVDDATVVLSWEADSQSANHRVLHENRERLQDFRTPEGARLEIIEIPLPQLAEVPGWRLPVLPASYVNFLILNTAVLVPVFGHKKRDTDACGILGELFSGREIVPVFSRDLVHEGGAVHCLSQQQPARPLVGG